jgi:hypothetical protein
LPEYLEKADWVWVRKDGVKKPLGPLYDGPFQVSSRQREFFRVKMGDREESVSTSRLKPAHVPPGTEPAQPPKRGRPKHVRFKEHGQPSPGG